MLKRRLASKRERFALARTNIRVLKKKQKRDNKKSTFSGNQKEKKAEIDKNHCGPCDFSE